MRYSKKNIKAARGQTRAAFLLSLSTVIEDSHVKSACTNSIRLYEEAKRHDPFLSVKMGVFTLFVQLRSEINRFRPDDLRDLLGLKRVYRSRRSAPI